MKSRRLTLILGGGLAGVSTAYHLKGPRLLVERESDVGGTARSFAINGFTFDFTGHLLHLHTPYTKKLITRLLQGNFFRCNRNAAIFSCDTYTRYPFQANTKGLPDDVVSECVLGFLAAYIDNQSKEKDFRSMNFERWCHEIFGPGISKHFMIPYNEKLYQVKARRLTVDWCGNFVPKPSLDEVVKGALVDQKKAFGYNTQFLYPKSGGIQVLAQSLAKKMTGIRLKTSIEKIDWRRKTATLSTGETVRYSHLVNTIPLAELLKRMRPLPPAVERARRRLKCVSILCLNIGVRRPKISDKSWIYFPEKKFPFYRVGFPMNFTPHIVPRGCSSMYVEVPLDTRTPFSKADILRRVRRGLIEARILRSADKLPVVQFLPIRYAYVIYDRHRSTSLRTIFSFLGQHSIQSIGRYGAWKYSFMEEAILDGKKAAEAINP